MDHVFFFLFPLFLFFFSFFDCAILLPGSVIKCYFRHGLSKNSRTIYSKRYRTVASNVFHGESERMYPSNVSIIALLIRIQFPSSVRRESRRFPDSIFVLVKICFSTRSRACSVKSNLCIFSRDERRLFFCPYRRASFRRRAIAVRRDRKESGFARVECDTAEDSASVRSTGRIIKVPFRTIRVSDGARRVGRFYSDPMNRHL